MSVRDQKFYANLFFWILFLGVLLRLVVQFVGIEMEVPYLDPFLETTMRILGGMIKSFANFLGGWTN